MDVYETLDDLFQALLDGRENLEEIYPVLQPGKGICLLRDDESETMLYHEEMVDMVRDLLGRLLDFTRVYAQRGDN